MGKETARDGCYWTNRFENGGLERRIDDIIEEFRELLIDACRIRLRADVPVGAYLSGGLDSSTIASSCGVTCQIGS